MLTNLEHIGIAVKSLAASNELFAKLLNAPPYKAEAVEAEGVTTSFFRVNESKIELLEATRPDSADCEIHREKRRRHSPSGV